MKTKTDIQFDMEATLAGLREGKGLSGKDGILTPLIKQLTETAMQAELDEHLANEEEPNRKNGSTRKTMKSPAGEFELATPRDRAGTFEPQIVKKHQTHLTDDLERKVLALFALGNLEKPLNVQNSSGRSAGTDAALSGVEGSVLSVHEDSEHRPTKKSVHSGSFSRFPLGNSHQDIRGHIAEIYDIELSNGTCVLFTKSVTR